jgi:TolB-like protein
MELAVARHDEILRRAIEGKSGKVFKTAGDAFFAAFNHSSDAVMAAVTAQRKLAQVDWASVGGLRVRMAVHFGTAEERGGDFFGPAVNRCARLLNLAHGGQLLVSASVAELLTAEREVREPLRLLGKHPLDDPKQPVDIFQVWILGLEQEFPPLRSTKEPPAPRVQKDLATVAVLPFANRSSSEEDEYFSDGLADELLTVLGKTQGLRVAARTSSFQFKNKHEDLATIGERLNVATLLEGSVRKSGSRVRISVQLVNVADGLNLWSETYDRTLDDIFAVQDDIAQSVVRGLCGTLIGKQDPSVAEPRLETPHVRQDTLDTAAYTDYLHGRHLLHEKRSEHDILEARRFFESALKRDPGFARARAGLASCHIYLANEGLEDYKMAMAAARVHLEHALGQDDSIAEAHFELSLLLLAADELKDAKIEAQRSIELNPNVSEPYRTLAQLEAGDGRIEKAVELLEAALKVDPLNLNVHAFLARAYFFSGLDAKGLAHCERAKRLVPYRIYCHLADHYLGKGELAQAENAVTQLEELRPSDPWTLSYRGRLAAAVGDDATSAAMVMELRALEARGSVITFLRGFVHCARGENEEFFACMQKANEDHLLPRMELMYSALFKDLRDMEPLRSLISRPS